MTGNHLSIILLPTNKCNVNCDYCFEDKTRDALTHERLSVIIEKVLDHMERCSVDALTIYGQGGEIMTMPPHWFERAYELIGEAAEARGRAVGASPPTNTIGYGRHWDRSIV